LKAPSSFSFDSFVRRGYSELLRNGVEFVEVLLEVGDALELCVQVVGQGRQVVGKDLRRLRVNGLVVEIVMDSV